MTAYASLFTASGFVVGADGRQRWGHSPTRSNAVRQLESDKVQKIFEVTGNGVNMGCVVYGDVASVDRKFDAAVELQNAIQSPRRKYFLTSVEYVSNVCAYFQDIIERLMSHGLLEERPKLNLHFSGYFKTVPCFVEAIFRPYYRFRSRLYDVNDHKPISPGYCSVAGSQLIGNLINAGDSRLSHFSRPIREDMTMSEAEDFVKGYIEACSSQIATEIDPEIKAEGIGGHIHIASITPESGFQWLIPPQL